MHDLEKFDIVEITWTFTYIIDCLCKSIREEGAQCAETAKVHDIIENCVSFSKVCQLYRVVL